MSTTSTTTTVDAVLAGPARRERSAPAPIPTGRLLGVELRKMFDTRSGFWLMASIVILSVVATGAVIIFAPREELTFNAFASAVGIPMSVILPMIAVLAVTSEWSQRTGLTTFTLVPSRGRVIGAKAALTVAIAATSMVVALGVGALGNLLGTAIAGVDPTWDISATQFAQIVLANVIGMMGGFTLGVLLRSSAAGIIGYFVWSFVLPGVSGALAGVQQWWADHAAWFDLNTAYYPLFDEKMTGEMWAQLGVTSVLWLVLPLTAGLWALLRSEVK
ncbi:ABC transporter permease [Nocardioides sp. GY 10113]|uniref:ABC transporter permease n=1 Tax=Nocardioides sp. GY 10113 TaxID=2569761 RepID=UPI0010A84E81|nr:ABC transporter permease [Nocardioides sp. GY 10113]TIC87984.1 ABC transporter permease [Nocardioides sp. GY 10113]